MVWKESREVAPLVALGLALQFYLLGAAMGLPLLPYIATNGRIPFVQDFAGTLLVAVACLAAAVLGLWQTVRESSGGTFPFLLHRPVPRSAIFGWKLLVGLAAYLVIAGLPLACYTLWAATPGTHSSPFFGYLAAASWGVVLQAPVIYFGAFLSGLRPGRWLGSRLLPLFGSIFAWAMAQGARTLTNSATVQGLTVAAIAACLVLAIWYVSQTRDYS